jgi:O-antigen ligase
VTKVVSDLFSDRREPTGLRYGFLLAMLLLVDGVAFFLSFHFSFKFVLLIVGLLLIGSVLAFSFKRTLIILISSIIIFQGPRYRTDILPFVISPKIIVIFLGALLLFWMFSISLAGRTNLKSSDLSFLLTLFLGMTFVASFVGIIHGAQPTTILSELIAYCYFVLFFAVIDQVADPKSIKRVLLTILIASIVVSFEYIYLFLSSEITLAGMGRIVTGQIHILYLAMTFLLSFFLWHRKMNKILFGLSLVPVIIALLISQTRGTWLASIIAVISTMALFIIDKRKTTALKMIGYGLLALLLLLLGIHLLTELASNTSLGFLVEARVRTLLSANRDVSVLMRVAQNWAVWERIKTSFLFGEGLGSILFIAPWYKVNWVDSTYLQLLWKFGIIGLLIFLGILALVLKKSIYIYRNTSSDFYKSFAVGMFSTFLGFAALGFISPVLIKYRFNIIWAVLFGLTHIVEGFVKEEVKMRPMKA